MASAPAPASGAEPSSTVRGSLSLVIFVHFFCVAVVLSSNLRRSALQGHLVSIFACYTQLLDFDPDFTPYYYTFGRVTDNDARLVVDLYANADESASNQPLLKTVTLPEEGGNWLGDRRRAIALARLVAMNSQPENESDDLTGEVAKAVGARVMRENNAHRAVVRCVQRLSQPLDLTELLDGYPLDNPRDPRYDVTTYEADVWLGEDGVELIKRSTRAEVAPRQRTSTPATPPAPGP